MPSYKMDILERQRLSKKYRWTEALQFLKEYVKRLRNTLKTTFLNFKLQRVCKSHHLQCTKSPKDSVKLEKSLCIRDNAKLENNLNLKRYDIIILLNLVFHTLLLRIVLSDN